MKPGYAVIGLYEPGKSKPTLMASNGKVIIFDTPNLARNFAPLLGNGRGYQWADAAEETIIFSPITLDQCNKAVILTNYDPYNLPPGSPTKSEVKLQEWKHHCHYSDWLSVKGQHQQREDGTWANLALGEEVR